MKFSSVLVIIGQVFVQILLALNLSESILRGELDTVILNL